jgi:hypothetical protein
MALTMKRLLKKLLSSQKGQALPMVLILMAMSGLILTPLLSYMGSGLKAGETYENIAEEFYAADAGVEDGLWHIKYDLLTELFSDYEPYLYNHDYDYPSNYTLEVNDIDVDVSISNIWIPKDIAVPSLSQAEELIGAGKLIIIGSVPAELTQQVNIYYYKEPSDGSLIIDEIGIWLPPGVDYNPTGNNTLESHLDSIAQDYTREITTHAGGKAVVWTFTEPLLFTELPGVEPTDTPMVSSFVFGYSAAQAERAPEAVAWITTSGVSDIPYAWDADVRVFNITSVAEGTTVDAYAVRSEMRETGSAISGDYRAIGNTLMIDQDPWHMPPVREILLSESDSTIDDIPDNAHVDKVYLYWSAWLEEGGQQQVLFEDDCDDIDNGNWYHSYYSDWSDYPSGYPGGPGGPGYPGYPGGYSYAFQAHHNYYGDRELEMVNPLDLSEYEPGAITVSWSYWLYQNNIESSDCLQYAISNTSGWSSWFNVFCDDGYGGGSTSPQSFSFTVPNDYMTDSFRISFRISGFEGYNEIVIIDDIRVESELDTLADTQVNFKINGQQVYYADDEYGNPTVPTIGYQPIIAEQWTVLENGPSDFSYSCRAEVTELVQSFADHGNAIYTVGGVSGTTHSQWSYAGWSLLVIYSSPETQRHQIYLYDDFLYMAPHTEGLEFPISGFIVPDPIAGETIAARITCFVGDGDDYYSGDFIAINAPDVPGYQIADSYKLWDGITLSAPSFPPWLPNTSSSPNNVWNSRSTGFGGSTIDGVDIDTFSIPWGDPPSSGLLKPGDSSATIVLNFADPNPMYAELIDFIYIIISFRSRTITGGTITYLVED